MTEKDQDGLIKIQKGTILVEAPNVLPFLIVIMLVMLKFGKMLLQNLHLQTGEGNAARFWSHRFGVFGDCTNAITRISAFYGHTSAPMDSVFPTNLVSVPSENYSSTIS